jgi:hypothetical protein
VVPEFPHDARAPEGEGGRGPPVREDAAREAPAIVQKRRAEQARGLSSRRRIERIE